MTMAGPSGSVDLTYSVPSDRVLEMKKPGGAKALRYQMEFVSPQEVVLIEANGQRMNLRRVE